MTKIDKLVQLKHYKNMCSFNVQMIEKKCLSEFQLCQGIDSYGICHAIVYTIQGDIFLKIWLRHALAMWFESQRKSTWFLRHVKEMNNLYPCEHIQEQMFY